MRSNKYPIVALSLVAFGLTGIVSEAAPADLPAKDQRGAVVQTLDTPRAFPVVSSKAEWRARAQEIREQILVSAGLWPMPERPPVVAHISGRTEHGDFSVEKVYFETLPGFYLAGNLYRPLGKGKGPFPAVLNPHGHWDHGRLEDTQSGSIPARCIHQARMGMVAFAYDMAGYNDTQFGGTGTTGYNTHRMFGTNAVDQLWNTSLMGLQTWDSLRALDFLAALPDVDARHIGCTGASGGGTQTFILGAIEDRLAMQAPTVMVSHSMQGGCSCENMPGLRIDHSNMEIAGVPAPRPQIMVAASGDWTRTTQTIEGPAVESVYRLFGAQDRLRYQVLNFNHNYNQTTREAVYVWLAKWLLPHPESVSQKEAAYPAATNLDLRVWKDGVTRPDTLTPNQLSQLIAKRAQARIDALEPRNTATLKHYKDVLTPGWERTLQVEQPVRQIVSETIAVDAVGQWVRTKLAFGRQGKNDRIPATLFNPAGAYKSVVVLVSPQGSSEFLDKDANPRGLARRLLEAQQAVLLIDPFLTGANASAEITAKRNYFTGFFTTYNRTDCQERVQDLVTSCAYVRTTLGKSKVILCGTDRAGLWALLAAPAANGVVADANGLDVTPDAALMAQDIFVPGIRNIGAFQGAALLAAPNPLVIHNTGGVFDTTKINRTYAALNATKALTVTPNACPEEELAGRILALGK